MKIFNRLSCSALFALMTCLQGCATSYSAKGLEGWVVDAGTKQPLEGANVVAHWVLSFGMEGGQQTDLVLMESVTDKAGHYSFPAWGPVQVPGNLPWEARMKNQDPEIIIYKSGYWSTAVSNKITGPQPGPGPLVRASDWNGKTIELKKFEDTLQRYGSIVSMVLTGVSYGHCNWKKIPRILVALNSEKKRLQKFGIYSSPPTIESIEAFSEGDHCGSVTEFFKEYQK